MMSHATALFSMLLALLAIDCQRGRSISLWAPVAGASLGMLFLTRPFDAALVGPVAGLWALGVGAKRLTLGALTLTGGSAALVAGLLFLYNAGLTGNPFMAPQQLWADHLFGPGVDEAVIDGDTGVLVSDGDVNALAGTIFRLHADRTELSRLGANARERAARDFTVEQSFGPLLKLL